MAFRGLALEGGGVLGVAYAGVAKTLERHGLYNKLTHISGSSAGAMAAGLIACRVPPEDIETILIDTDFTTLTNDGWMVTEAYRLWHDFGWYRGDAIEKVYGDILERTIGDRHITYERVRERFGTTLVTATTEVTQGITIFQSPDTTPHLKIAAGIRRSSSIPIVFCPAKDGNRRFVDGGMLDNYPIQELYRWLPKDNVLGVAFRGDQKRVHALPPCTSITAYARRLVDILQEQALRVHVDEEDWSRTILVPHIGVSPTDFDISEMQKCHLVAAGEKYTNDFLEKVLSKQQEKDDKEDDKGPKESKGTEDGGESVHKNVSDKGGD